MADANVAQPIRKCQFSDSSPQPGIRPVIGDAAAQELIFSVVWD
jgi:hypothetical protein